MGTRNNNFFLTCFLKPAGVQVQRTSVQKHGTQPMQSAPVTGRSSHGVCHITNMQMRCAAMIRTHTLAGATPMRSAHKHSGVVCHTV